MSDIFREVDEDIRREQVKRLWDRFAPYILGLAVLIVVGVAGWRGYEYWQETRAEATGDRFLAALQLSDDGKHEEAIAALQAITADGSGGYPTLARFRIATEKAQAGDVPGAVAEFDTIAAGNAPTEIKLLARIRAALLLADTATVADLEQRIGDLAGVGNAWRHTAREVLGLAAWRSGDYQASRKYFTEIATDQETPSDLRQRAQLMLTLIAGKLGPEVVTAPATETAPAAEAAPAEAAAPADAAAPAEPTP
jgi:hypothetical protein